MTKSLKQRGQKFLRRFSRITTQASEDGKRHIRKNLISRIGNVREVGLLILEWGLLVLALAMLAIAQSFWFKGSYTTSSFVAGGTYAEATLGEVESMNPLFAITNSEKVLSKLMFATVSTIDYSGHPNTGVAESIVPSENGKIWTVKIREGLKWSDGEPITGEDLLFTANLIKNPNTNTIYNANLANVKVSMNEFNEVIFELPTAYADFISALNFPLVPEHVLKDKDPKTLIEDSFSTAPITSGAFSFNATQTAARSGEKVIYLSANPEYYKGKPLLNSFEVHAYSEKKQIIDAINSGVVTATAELSDAEKSKIMSSQFNQRISLLNSGAFIFINTTRDVLKAVEVRSAIRQGIDMEKIRLSAPHTTALDYPLLDAQIKTNYPPIPERDFEAAREKIRELTEGQEVVLEVATLNSGYLPNVSQALAEELNALGIDTNVSVHEESQEFINNIISKRNYDILVYEVELGADPDLLPYYHSSQAMASGLNLSNYRNGLMDDILLGARDTLDEALRIKKYESFLELWVTGVPAIGIYRPTMSYFFNKNVREFGDNVQLVTALDRFTDVNSWAAIKATKNKTP